MAEPIGLWARAFLATNLWEGAVHQLLLGRSVPRLRLVGWTLLLNTSTHPALWYVVPRFDPYWLWTLTAEIGVAATESALLGLLLRRDGHEAPWRTGALVAVSANVLSTIVGLLGLW